MERLILLRHGKAEAGSLSGDDFDRALTERGRQEAILVGKALIRAGLSPTIALVSPAARARETWEAMADAFPAARLALSPALYQAEPDEILQDARTEAADDAASVLVIGHNPGLHELALRLARSAQGSSMDRARLEAGFPTGAACAFDLRTNLFAYFTPKSIAGGA